MDGPTVPVSLDIRVLLPGLLTVAALVGAALVAFSALGGSVGVGVLPESAGKTDKGQNFVLAEGPISGSSDQRSRSRAGGEEAVGASSPATARDGSASFDSADDGASAAPDAGAGADDGGTPAGPPAGSPGIDPQPIDPQGPSAPAPEVPAEPATPMPSEGKSGGDVLSGTIGTVNETVTGLTGIDPGIDAVAAPVVEPADELVSGLTGD